MAASDAPAGSKDANVTTRAARARSRFAMGGSAYLERRESPSLDGKVRIEPPVGSELFTWSLAARRAQIDIGLYRVGAPMVTATASRLSLA